MPLYDSKLQTFLDFVLAQYVSQGVGELDQEKLSHLLELKYQTINDATDQLGTIPAIRDAFIGFQSYLYLDENDRLEGADREGKGRAAGVQLHGGAGWARSAHSSDGN